MARIGAFIPNMTMLPAAESLAYYQPELAQTYHQLQAGNPEAETHALNLLKHYRRWLNTQTDRETLAALLEPAVEALKDALTRQCRL